MIDGETPEERKQRLAHRPGETPKARKRRLANERQKRHIERKNHGDLPLAFVLPAAFADELPGEDREAQAAAAIEICLRQFQRPVTRHSDPEKS